MFKLLLLTLTTSLVASAQAAQPLNPALMKYACGPANRMFAKASGKVGGVFVANRRKWSGIAAAAAAMAPSDERHSEIGSARQAATAG